MRVNHGHQGVAPWRVMTTYGSRIQRASFCELTLQLEGKLGSPWSSCSFFADANVLYETKNTSSVFSTCHVRLLYVSTVTDQLGSGFFKLTPPRFFSQFFELEKQEWSLRSGDGGQWVMGNLWRPQTPPLNVITQLVSHHTVSTCWLGCFTAQPFLKHS